MSPKLCVFLPSVAALAVLTGCQSAAIKSNDSESLLIEHLNLSHLSAAARVEITISQGSSVLYKETVQGLADLPYPFPLKALDALDNSQAEVTVMLGAETVLQGQTTLRSGQPNRLLLRDASSAQLSRSYWRGVDMAGRGVPPGVETTLAFDDAGQLTGYAGCNYYSSAYESSARFIEVKPARLTRQICSPPVMYHENRYLQLLTGADYYQIDGEGRLRLYVDGRDKPLLFAPSTAENLKISLNAGQ
ncbi:META domain-containing protein [Neptuniibacter halophilus]|uniref:META domain-containing protein n=1 Tax=Neptuniibacter halophilus TaxID=651666 RepID=UPI0025740096|nr:META domain-containing protein [Neptuniibacter halophilus]